MDSADVVVVGAGLAGLQCARLAARAGLRVILADRKETPDQFIHTTGIFVRRTFDEFRFPEGILGPPIRRVSLHSPSGQEVRFESDRDEFRIGRMATLYTSMLEDACAAGASFRGGVSFSRLDYGFDRTILRFSGRHGEQRVSARVVVAADGAVSRVAPALGLGSPRQFLTGFEEVYRRRTPALDRRLRCFLDPAIAPGYIAWIADDGEEVHVGVAGESWRFEPRQAIAGVRRIAMEHLDTVSLDLRERRGGRIPCDGILREIATTRGLLAGDAAGAVSPLTGGGLDAAIRLSAFAAQSIVTAIRSGTRLDALYSGERFRARFIARLWMRRLFSLLSPLALEAGVSMLRSTPMRRLGEKVFFGHGSFPITAADLSSQFRTVVEEAA